MSALGSYFQPGSPMNIYGGTINSQKAYARTDGALAQSRLQRQYQSRLLPGVINDAATKGTLYGGQVGVRKGQLAEDVENQSFDIQQRMDRTLTDLTRKGLMARAGIMV